MHFCHLLIFLQLAFSENSFRNTIRVSRLSFSSSNAYRLMNETTMGGLTHETLGELDILTSSTAVCRLLVCLNVSMVNSVDPVQTAPLGAV